MKQLKTSSRIMAMILCLVMMFSLSACSEAKESQRQVFAMDTVMSLIAYGPKAESGLSAAESVILSMDAMLDPDLETSTTYAINNANGANVSISGQVAKMLSTADIVYKQTNGALDLSIFPVIERWGFHNSRYYVPTEEELASDLSMRCFDGMVLTSFPSSGSYAVSFPAGAKLSFAAVGKGNAAENAIIAMRNVGVTSGLISMGGNVQTLGLKPDGSNWNIAIQDPNNPSTYLGVISTGETAVVTSGGYQRYFTQNGKIYHHLINPENGNPINNTLSSVTIICNDGTMADCLSTGMFILGESKALNYWRTYGGFEMILINKDKHITCTKGLIEKFTLINEDYTLSYTE